MEEPDTRPAEPAKKETSFRFDMLILGVALIAVGIVLLMSTLNPDFDFSLIFAEYWPVLVILAGLVKILQSVIGQNQNGVLGTFFFIFIVLALASGGIWNIFWDGEWIGGWQSALIHSENQVIETTGNEMLVVETNRIDVKIVASNTSNLRLRGEVRGHHHMDEDWNESDFKRMVSIEQTDQQITITCDKTGYTSRRDFNVWIELTVPAELAVKADAHRADLSFYGMQGRVEAGLEYGDLYARGISGLLLADVTNGDLTVRDASGPLRLTGDRLEIDLNEIYGNLTIDAGRGDIEFYNRFALAGNIDMELDRGAVEIDLTGDSNFSFSGATGSGRVYVDFNDIDEAHRESFQFSNGESIYTIAVRSGRGNISLED